MDGAAVWNCGGPPRRGQHLLHHHSADHHTRRGQSFWPSLFQGDALPGSGQEEGKPDFGAPLPETVASAVRDVTLSWTLIASAVLGIWLMFTRLIFGTELPMADSDHLIGALVITVAVIAVGW